MRGQRGREFEPQRRRDAEAASDVEAALYFFDPAALAPLDPARPARNPEVVVLDEDEWPGAGQGRRYRRGDPVLHIELRRWAEVFLIAPLDANTLAKLALGLTDNCLTCAWRAWDPEVRAELTSEAVSEW